jgi:hypothetical protein
MGKSTKKYGRNCFIITFVFKIYINGQYLIHKGSDYNGISRF